MTAILWIGVCLAVLFAAMAALHIVGRTAAQSRDRLQVMAQA
jgi:hypothetical protein